MAIDPILPAYSGPCVTGVMPSMVAPNAAADWVPAPVREAEQSTVLLVLDGLGWDQLQDRTAIAPTIAGMQGGPITTVAPTTTSTALTSIASGLTPGEHGIVGYRMGVQDHVLNVLRWSTADGDARRLLPPREFQVTEPFLGERPPVVSKAEFVGTGFTMAHLQDVRFVGYRTVSTLITEVVRLAAAGEPFVYAYYDGIDKVSHEFGLGEHFDRELRWADLLVAELLDALPSGTVLGVTADHGQVETGDRLVELDPGIRPHLSNQSGEGRFRWLHARPGRKRQLFEAAEVHSDTGWVRTRDQLIDEGWFGPVVTDSARGRLGDVALIAREPVAYVDPADSGPFEPVGRHGSVTSAEIYVPFVAATC